MLICLGYMITRSWRCILEAARCFSGSVARSESTTRLQECLSRNICFFSLSHKDRKWSVDLLHSQTVSTLGRETNSQNISEPNGHTELPFLTSNLLIPSIKEKKRKLLEIYSPGGCVLFNTNNHRSSQV